MTRWFLAGFALLVSTNTAVAFDPYAWGVGPYFGTGFLPGAYPVGFPKKVKNLDFDDVEGPDDFDDDGEPDFEQTTLNRVRFDGRFGAQGSLWFSPGARLSAHAGLDLGKQYTEAYLQLLYDQMFDVGQAQLYAGGGIGFSGATFKGQREEKLKLPNYPLRAEAGLIIPDGPRGYEGRVFGQLAVPSRHKYTDPGGTAQDVSCPVCYFTVGLEVAVLFGQVERN